MRSTAIAITVTFAIAMLASGHLRAEPKDRIGNVELSECAMSLGGKVYLINEAVGHSVQLFEIDHFCSLPSEISIYTTRGSFKLSPPRAPVAVKYPVRQSSTVLFHFPNREDRARSCKSVSSSARSNPCKRLFTKGMIRGKAHLRIQWKSRRAPVSDDLVVISRFPAL